MKSVPEQLDDKKVTDLFHCPSSYDRSLLQDDIHKILEEFSMLDEFHYNLSNEDFAMK